MRIALVHPGEMGAAIGAALRAGGHDVLWASEGRSPATAERARAAGLHDVGRFERLRDADAVVSVCPPHAALDVARACVGFDGIYVDANAVSPQRAQEVAALQPRFVDGGIVGGPRARLGAPSRRRPDHLPADTRAHRRPHLARMEQPDDHL